MGCYNGIASFYVNYYYIWKGNKMKQYSEDDVVKLFDILDQLTKYQRFTQAMLNVVGGLLETIIYYIHSK